MKLQDIFRHLSRVHKPQKLQERGKHQIYSGSEENFIQNGGILLEERISLFHGRSNPIRFFSVDELNSMNVDKEEMNSGCWDRRFRGVWDGKSVQVKVFSRDVQSSTFACREIAVATEMATHRNVHRLLGCCLHTDFPVLVYEWEEKGTLVSRINKQHKEAFEWKDRLRIAWEIAHAIVYLHTAFPRPIIHRDITPYNVYLDQDDSAKLSDFDLSISIPAGEKHVEELVMGTMGYVAPEYMQWSRVAESSDVFAFGTVLLVLLTGVTTFSSFYRSEQYPRSITEWVSGCQSANRFSEVVDKRMSRNVTVVIEERHLTAIAELALSCSAQNEECRPSMTDVAMQLKTLIISSSNSLSS